MRSSRRGTHPQVDTYFRKRSRQQQQEEDDDKKAQLHVGGEKEEEEKNQEGHKVKRQTKSDVQQLDNEREPPVNDEDDETSRVPTRRKQHRTAQKKGRTAQTEPEQPALFAEVGYKVRGQSDDLTDSEAQVVEHIEVSGTLGCQMMKDILLHVMISQLTHEIPDDFNLNKEDYGCISGTSYEKRLIRAYELQLIPLKRNHTYEKMCRICAEKGHFSDDCPKVFDERFFSQKAPIAYARDNVVNAKDQ